MLFFFSVWLELCISLPSDLSENGRLTSGDQWEVTDLCFFDRICVFFSVSFEWKGTASHTVKAKTVLVSSQQHKAQIDVLHHLRTPM